ncbi:hypothetical protein DMH03_40720 [Amycolatopsis sp. WAC 01376]|nr:hypothetical protein DMH03_40720 [Amycolatopsis sp. WAC 01376]
MRGDPAFLWQSLQAVRERRQRFRHGVDLAAERVIRRVLREAYPRDVILGEEYGANTGDESRIWLIDPLCGTVATQRGRR